MTELRKEKATGQGGSSNVAGGQAGATTQKKTRYCSDDHISKVVKEIRAAGLQLRSTATDTQQSTLPKVLELRGARGLNTYEGVALGYLRIATRIKELKETYDIGTIREDVVGPDGLRHIGVARYYLIGKKVPVAPAQTDLGLEVPA